jgi:DNA-binding HxlR family transcriptional regulator
MLNSYAFLTLQRLTKHDHWSIMEVLADRPATFDQLAVQTGLTRNRVLTVTKELEALGLLARPRYRKPITGLVVARQPELLKAFMGAFDDYYDTMCEERREAAERQAEQWREPAPHPVAHTSRQGQSHLRLVHSA